MRARAKAAKQYFCGVPGSYSGGLRMIRLISANEPIEALFLYVEERTEGHDPMDAGDEVVVFEATDPDTFVLIDDDEPEAAQVVEQAGE
jgi:hypothetical protein